MPGAQKTGSTCPENLPGNSGTHLYMKEGDDTDVDNDFAEASLKDAWREAGICPPRMESPPPCAGGSCATASSAVELRVVGG